MLNIFPIPAFQDNYIWALHDGQHAAVVDPGDAAPVRAWLEEHQLRLVAILCTHRHNDHTGGVCELAQVYNAAVYGPRLEDIPCINHKLGEADVVEIRELNLRLEVLDIPGHTCGHIAYVNEGCLFCGDTLFGCGCGRVFDGTAQQLHHSLQRLAKLPDETRVYCAHEYTEASIHFALVCEPGNAQLKQREADAHALRAAGQPTLPSTIALEKSTNPFLRCTEPEIILNIELNLGSALPSHDEVDTFAALRKWKNTF
ncbi:MAG: hydroxyacylglutathione hydrolase [Nitrosomonadales bacterium]|nr:hydroxyacylglutathione hydrolase [Nitrosomonadales bacterium]